MSKNGYRGWKRKSNISGEPDKVYALKIGGNSYAKEREKLQVLAEVATQGNDWRAYNEAQDTLLRKYGQVVVGYNLPPGKELPKGHGYGAHGKVILMPVEEEREFGTCWEDRTDMSVRNQGAYVFTSAPIEEALAWTPFD
jgi:hypothetical protein